jgi:hypothetical protein
MIAPVPPRLSSVTDPEEETPKVGDLGVVVWRFDSLARSGYPTEMAAALAENAAVDLHDAMELMKRGAKPEDALRILT